MKPSLLAYQIDDDESSVILYARHAVAARREGANDLNTDFQSVSCRRAPQWDRLYPKGPTQTDLWKAGWHFTCSFCFNQAREDCGGYHDGWHFFCERCADFYTMRPIENPRFSIDFFGPWSFPNDRARKWEIVDGEIIEYAPPVVSIHRLPLRHPGGHHPYHWYRP